MNPDDLDKILLSERQVEPSSSFTGNVMARIQTEASHGRWHPFPWIGFAAIALVLAIVGIWSFPADLFLRAMQWLSYSLGKWIIAPPDIALRNALLSASASLLGTLLAVWLSLGLAGARR